MEVHHHSHSSPAAGSASHKKWSHYFWEFLMLFLAVLCGFMAENQREHIVEHKRENAFMATMLSDLRSDTGMLSNMHRTFVNVILHLDSLTLLLEEDELMDNNAEKIYQHQVNLNLFYKCVFADQPIKELGQFPADPEKKCIR